MGTTVSIAAKAPSHGAWWEISLIIVVSLLISLFLPALKVLTLAIPLVYLLVDWRLRRRTWTEIGFNARAFPRDLVGSLGWVLLVGIGTQAIAVFGAYLFLPDYAAHLMARIPFDARTIGVSTLVAFLISTLWEEIIFRGVFQARLSSFVRLPAAIGITSLVFALMHFAAGPFMIVFFDLAFVFIDSLVYGIIFARSHNLLVAWMAHFVADVVGLSFLLLLM